MDGFSLLTLYLGCAALGGGVMLLQTVLTLFGGGVDADGDFDADVDSVDADHGTGFSLLSVRSVAGFLLFFGLVGWGGHSDGWGTFPTLLAATAAGASVMLLVAWALAFFRRLTESGTLDLEDTVGATARVYLRVPGKHAGRGKVTVAVDGQSVELQAVTAGPELATGSACRVVRLVEGDTVEVEPA